MNLFMKKNVPNYQKKNSALFFICHNSCNTHQGINYFRLDYGIIFNDLEAGNIKIKSYL